MNSILNKINNKSTFSNGYTASVSYYPDTDEHEVAVLVNGRIVYDTTVTTDVVRCKTAHGAFDIVVEIMNLPNIGSRLSF